MYLAPPERVLALRLDGETLLRPKLREALRERQTGPLPPTVQPDQAGLLSKHGYQ
ncbi:hypothetical protein ACIGXM_23015 [Kitasatospora sp. NPDC052896]|uniref:hypothetical protein n=1 Tax=Kitasatospora sp. NPDC052896 TaxID=3364061 RepID=UPI0037C56DA5